MEQIEVVIADDQPVFRAGVLALLQSEEDMVVLGEAVDGVEAVRTVMDLNPDVVVMDLSMPNLNGIDATREILTHAPDTKILALSIHSSRRYVTNMLKAGAKGYILKESAAEELVKGIRSIYRGDIYLDSSITGMVLKSQEVEPDQENLSILQTKLHRPRVNRDIVFRSRIVNQLESNAYKPFSLISAPAGFGKSVAVSQWLQHTNKFHTWLSLDSEHNDLRIFLSYLHAAVEKIFPGVFVQTGKMLQAIELPPIKVIAYSVINDLDRIDEDFILVLDDYHLIKEKKIHQLLNELLQYPPEHLHLSIITRTDPPLKINSLSAHGRMAELRMNDLSFTHSEISALFQELIGRSLKPEFATVILEKTEGWIVGLRMAFMNLKGTEDVDSIVNHLRGDSHSVSLYLLEEVILKQPVEVQEMLLDTAVLNRFTADLVDAIYSKDDHESLSYSGEQLIRWLIQSNMFIIALDDQRRWFRYHHLIKDLLTKSLQKKRSPEEISKTHLRASRWFERQHLIEESIDHMLASGDLNEACRIVERHRWAKLDEDRWYVVQKWIDKLPVESRKQHPILMLSECWPLYEQFQLEKIPVILSEVEVLLKDQSHEEELWGEVYFFYGAIYYWSGQGDEALLYFEKAQKVLLPDRMLINGLLQLLSGLSLSMTGEGEEGLHLLNQQVKATESRGGVFVSRLRGGLFFVTYFLGKLAQARKETQLALLVAQKSGIDYSSAWNYYMEACTDLQSNQLDRALLHFTSAAESRYILHTRGAIDSVAGLAITQQLMGNEDEASATLDLMVEFAEELQDPLYMIVARSCRARIALMRNELTLAQEWEKSAGETLTMAGLFMWLEVPTITQVRVLLATGTPACLKKAGTLIEEVMRISRECHFTNHVIEGLVLKALLHAKRKSIREAKETLSEAISLSEPGGWIRPFKEAGSEMIQLLTDMRPDSAYLDFINHLLDQLAIQPTDKAAPLTHEIGQIHEKVSQRESEIILMMSRGLRNKEIADKLFVAEGTVKKHVYNICQKWNVKNRISMLAIARKYGLTDENLTSTS